MPGVRERIVQGLITGPTASPAGPLTCSKPDIKLVGAMATTQPRKAAKPPKNTRVRAASTVERYTPRRLAQFLLENATDASDYARARRAVRKLGIDPDRVPHDPPARS